MPPNVIIAVFILGAILLLAALVDGPIKLFGVEITSNLRRVRRIIAGIVGTVLISVALLNPFERSSPPLPSSSASGLVTGTSNSIAASTQIVTTATPACYIQATTAEETITRLMHAEAEAVKAEDISIIKTLFDPHAIIIDTTNKTPPTDPLKHYTQLFSDLTFTEAANIDIDAVTITASEASYTSGSRGSYIRSNGTSGSYLRARGSNKWTFRKNESGCWVITRFEFQ